MVPFRFGRYIAKYRIVPGQLQPRSLLENLALFGRHGNAMHRLLEGTLAGAEIKFDFQVQLRTSERTLPIEDATVKWPESESPYQTVAHIAIPQQAISCTNNGADERRAFNVWNALIDHRPLGGINRVRRHAYVLFKLPKRRHFAGAEV